MPVEDTKANAGDWNLTEIIILLKAKIINNKADRIHNGSKKLYNNYYKSKTKETVKK